VVFGISTTFATLVLMRTREALVRSASTRDAICVGLRQTAAATTGAGLVMAAALIPFANTDLINVRQFGIGVAIAILLEVVLVRPVLLPAAEAVLGRLGWWPTQGAGPDVPRRPRDTTRRLPIPHRRPRIAHH
jgi:RND superfamily putative drug exporter